MDIGGQERHAFEDLHWGGMAKRAWAFLLLRLLFCLAVLASCAGLAATPPTPGQPSATPAPGDIQHGGLVGQLSGNTLRAVAVQGRYAYLVDGDLRIVDLADPRRPAEAGFVDLPDGSTQAFVAARGSRVYVTGAGLQVLDVSDPARPVVLAQHEVPGGDVAVAGELACVVGPGVYVLGIAP
jgi:hypothetical protein